MAGLDALIRALQRFSDYQRTTFQTRVPESLIEENINLIRDSVYASASLAVRRHSELAAYPSLRDHLIEIIRIKLSKPENFFDITGIYYSKNTRMFELETPKLVSLGDYSDWLSMKEAGQNLFDVKRPGQSQAQKLSGWRWYYTSWKQNRTKDGDKYPAIINARLSWGRGAEKAPYWYFIDRGVSGRGYPTQQTVGLSDRIARTSKHMVTMLNNQLATADQENYIVIVDGGIVSFVDMAATAISNGNPIPDIGNFDVFQVYGNIEGIPTTSAGIIEAMADGKLRQSATYDGGTKFHYYIPGGGFAGIYAKKLIE